MSQDNCEGRPQEEQIYRGGSQVHSWTSDLRMEMEGREINLTRLQFKERSGLGVYVRSLRTVEEIPSEVRGEDQACSPAHSYVKRPGRRCQSKGGRGDSQ